MITQISSSNIHNIEKCHKQDIVLC